MHSVSHSYFLFCFVLFLSQSEEKEKSEDHLLGLTIAVALFAIVFAVVSTGLAIKFKRVLKRLKDRRHGKSIT